MCQKVREKFYRMAFEYYRANIHRHVACTNVLVYMCACHTPSIAFRHLPPNSARFGYATEGALYLRAVVHRRGQRPPKGLGTSKTLEAA